MFKRSLFAAALLAAGTACSTVQAEKDRGVTLQVLGTRETGQFGVSAAEIVAHDPATQQLFVTNAGDRKVDILDIRDPLHPARTGSIDVSTDLPDTGGVNSVAVRDGIVAVAVEHDNKQANGWVAFYDTAGTFLNSVPAGALPDMVTFTNNGAYVLTANEGEPSDDYTVDPQGSVSIVDLRNGVMNATVAHALFTGFNESAADAAGVRTPQPYGATVAEDLEPEYIATSQDSKTAWVTLQENNAIAIVDIPSATVTGLMGLGCKDHSLARNALDPSDRDAAVDNGPLRDGINISTWPVCGLYMPDAIDAYQSNGSTWLVMANEGDSREYLFDADSDAGCGDVNPAWEFDDGECLTYTDEGRIGKVDLALPGYDAAMTEDLQENAHLGRLKLVTTEGNTDADAAYEELYSFGARSFTIRDTAGNIIFDSGADFERITAARIPDDFNSNNDENGSFDDRSDDKGPEPEGVAIGKVRGETYAFIGLERVGGIMIYNITDPTAAAFVDYVNNRNFGVAAETSAAGDLGPEGLLFIKPEDSPNGLPLLVVGNEVSGTTTLYAVVER